MADLLIIDDDPRGASVLARLLRAEGHQVSYAATPGEALRSLRQQPPDLLVIDLRMPRVDGLDLLDAFSSDAQFAHIPVVLYTGHNDPAARHTAQQLGACDYILKGDNWRAVLDRIEQCLRRQQPS